MTVAPWTILGSSPRTSLVLQRGDRQWPLSAVRLRDIRPAGRLRPVCRSRLNRLPRMIVVYASPPPSPTDTQPSTTRRALPLTWAGLAPAGTRQLPGAPIHDFRLYQQRHGCRPEPAPGRVPGVGMTACTAADESAFTRAGINPRESAARTSAAIDRFGSINRNHCARAPATPRRRRQGRQCPAALAARPNGHTMLDAPRRCGTVRLAKETA